MNLIDAEVLDRKCWYYMGQVEEGTEFKIKIPTTSSPPARHALCVRIVN